MVKHITVKKNYSYIYYSKKKIQKKYLNKARHKLIYSDNHNDNINSITLKSELYQ